MSQTIDVQVFYTGRVQGVGFRYTVKQTAGGFDVVGWVRNLPDGRVEVQAGGEEAEVEGFLQAISNGQLAAHIKQVERASAQRPAEGWRGFEVRR